MKKQKFKILFMDDEIDNPGLAQDAYKKLLEQGYQVDKTNKMSTVLNSFEKEFYHLYILDIDMQKVEDSIEGTGFSVGDRLKKLSSMAKVLMFSALGTVNEWFESVNYNFDGYIHKQDGLSALVDRVEEIRKNYSLKQGFSFDVEQPEEKKALLYYNQGEQTPAQEKLVETLKENGVQEVEVVNKLAQLLDKKEKQEYSLILLVADKFTTHPKLLKRLEEVFALEPKPHVITIVYGDDRYINSILALVNFGPFRLLNSDWTNLQTRLVKAVKSALELYGQERSIDISEDESIEYPVDKAELEQFSRLEEELSDLEVANLEKEGELDE